MLKRRLLLALLMAVTLAVSAPWASSSEDESRIPAYHSAPPAKSVKLPPILGREQLWGGNDQFPFQSHAYELASKIQSVIYQMPCYCYCDRMGHKSLRSCYEGTHAAECGACLKELYYTYQMHKKGKTAKQIRKGIIAGEWKQVNLQTAASIQ